MTPSIQVSHSNSDSESGNNEVTTRQHKRRIITDSGSDDSDSESPQKKIQEEEQSKAKLRELHRRFLLNPTVEQRSRFMTAYWKYKDTPGQRKAEDARKQRAMRTQDTGAHSFDIAQDSSDSSDSSDSFESHESDEMFDEKTRAKLREWRLKAAARIAHGIWVSRRTVEAAERMMAAYYAYETSPGQRKKTLEKTSKS